jgi:hypothetical protein
MDVCHKAGEDTGWCPATSFWCATGATCANIKLVPFFSKADVTQGDMLEKQKATENFRGWWAFIWLASV